MEELLTTEELAQRLRSTTRFVRRLVAEKRIEYVKVGRHVRFEESAVLAYIERNTVRATSRTELRRDFRRVA
jgi:excisionase family DNA binding protein